MAGVTTADNLGGSRRKRCCRKRLPVGGCCYTGVLFGCAGRKLWQTSALTGLNISADGRIVVGALEDGTCRGWRLGPNGSPDVIASLGPEKHEGKVVALRHLYLSADGRTAAMAFGIYAKVNGTGQQKATPGEIRIWDP